MKELSKSELELLFILYEHGKIRWENLVKESKSSRRTVHKNVKRLIEKGYIEKEEEKGSSEYPVPVYYSIADLPSSVSLQLEEYKRRELISRILLPFDRFQKIQEEFKSLAILKSLEEIGQSFENMREQIQNLGLEFNKYVERIQLLTKDIEKAVERGEIGEDIMKLPLDEATRHFLKYKIETGKLSPEILQIPLQEAILKYLKLRVQTQNSGS
jgi:predicted HTH transcriptional regulator